MELIKAQEKAQELMSKWGLWDWKFGWLKSVNVGGRCCYSIKCIKLGKQYIGLFSEFEVIDVILHEIAHALVGSRQGHNGTWRAMCRKVGARPERCFNNGVQVEKRYEAICSECGHRFLSQRMTRNMRRGFQFHSPCKRKVVKVEEIYLKWVENNSYGKQNLVNV